MTRPAWTLGIILSLALPVSAQDLNARLLEAAKKQDAAQIEKLLKQGANPNTKDKNGRTALMWAASMKSTEGVRALLAKGANVNAKDKTGWTALMSAARNGQTDAVLALLKGGADANMKDNNGWTALMSGAASGRADVLGALLDGRANVNAKDKNGWTALIVAASSGYQDSALALLKRGADANARDKDGNTALSLARKYNYSAVVAVLTTFSAATQQEIARKPIPQTAADASAAKPGTPSSIPSPSSASSPSSTSSPSPPGSAALVSPAQQNLNQQLLDAAQMGDTANVQNLLQKGADVNGRGAFGNTPLMYAALTGHADTARLLLDRGALVNARGNTGRTALIEAAVEGYADTARLLLEKGTEVNAKDDGGWTALFWAAFSQRTDVVRVLLEKGADVNARNKYEDTPLIRAAYRGDIATVKVLLEKGADLNAKDNTGKTALIEASEEGHAEVVGALLDKGADLSIHDRDGNTALSLAEKHNYANVIALLKKSETIRENSVKGSAATDKPEISPAKTTNPPSLPTATPALDKNAQGQAYFRMGLNMRMIETWWSRTSDVASGWALSLHRDLQRTAAPSDLVTLASQAQAYLKSQPKQGLSAAPRLIHDLRARLDQFCNAHPENKFFYAAGGFTYQLTLLSEALETPAKAPVKVGDTRREILPLATTMTEQCLVTEHCKDLALIYFSEAASILKKPELAAADGTALLNDAHEIEKALEGEDH